MARWFYIYSDTRNVPESKKYFYTETFKESDLYKSPIKPPTITFAKSTRGDWFEVGPNRPSYPMPTMTNDHYTTTYSYLLDWILNNKRNTRLTFF